MTCEDFIEAVEKMMDERRLTGMARLSSEMRLHIEQCEKCKSHFEEMAFIEESLNSVPKENVPPELYWKLMRIAKDQQEKSYFELAKPVFVNAMKIVIPVLAIWIISLFLPAPVRITTGILIYISGLVIVFEKLGRRLITDRV